MPAASLGSSDEVPVLDNQEVGWYAHTDQLTYRIVANSNLHYYLGNQLLGQRSQYIRSENPLHKQSEKAFF